MVQRQQPVCFTVIASARPSSSESPRARTFFFKKCIPSLMFGKLSLSLSLSPLLKNIAPLLFCR